ncbi:hypothetical protein AKJ53_00825 [candidate division MSBL1 archaeon SCGC-AAA382F02]|uniref:Uncharacterized protein n=1 Tax=candidate division MSBL1 archaeon SCGC-AAA382F02 TaxID=1698282 RepID=A0A133VIK5_9EURY|nr:hypothetical protein AKJ53_00825 [candidate division MSBL1 archaeon SCGC-AAA382F02]
MKKIEVGNVSFKVGEVKEVLKNNLEEEESHIGAVRECLERYYDEHLEKSASRGGFRKGSSSG